MTTKDDALIEKMEDAIGTDLLPCPFCGGDAERQDFETVGTELGNDPNAGGSCICCKTCGASSPVHFDRKENLYSSWNGRAALAVARKALIREAASAFHDAHFEGKSSVEIYDAILALADQEAE